MTTKWPTENAGRAFADAWTQLQANQEGCEMVADMARTVCKWFGESTDGNMNELERRASRLVYKATECGAWLRFDHQKIATNIGSIIEGSDAEVTAGALMWPFTQEEFWTTLQWVDDEVDRIIEWDFMLGRR